MVSIQPDAGGTMIVTDCAVLKPKGVFCFTKF
jgi:hypothetical protein